MRSRPTTETRTSTPLTKRRARRQPETDDDADRAPATPRESASKRNWPRMSRRRAPTDIRTPISRVRCSTDASRMFMIPTPPTTTETAAARIKTTIRATEIARARRTTGRHALDLVDGARAVALARGSPRRPDGRRQREVAGFGKERLDLVRGREIPGDGQGDQDRLGHDLAAAERVHGLLELADDLEGRTEGPGRLVRRIVVGEELVVEVAVDDADPRALRRSSASKKRPEGSACSCGPGRSCP